MKSPKKPPALLRVKYARHVTPNMIRITLASPAIRKMPENCEGANCKLFLPAPGQSDAAFAAQLRDGPRPKVRTYTVRHMRPQQGEMDIDFVDHGAAGPASASMQTTTLSSRICPQSLSPPPRLRRCRTAPRVSRFSRSITPTMCRTSQHRKGSQCGGSFTQTLMPPAVNWWML